MSDKTTGLDPKVIDPTKRTIEAMALELDRVNAENAAMKAALTAQPVPQAAGVVDGTVWLSMDGNCGCALLGANLQEGESEFVCIDDAPENYTDLDSKSRWAMTQAHKRLCARMGKQLGFYWNYPAQATIPLPSEPVLSEQAALQNAASQGGE